MTEKNGFATTDPEQPEEEPRLLEIVRNYAYIDHYLNMLVDDVYGQPVDHSHTAWAVDALSGMLPTGTASVLDVGCGHGFLAETFRAVGIDWNGVTLGDDFVVCETAGLPVYHADQSFLPFEDNQYDLVFARHILEHSPMPLLTLMEWRRVSKDYLLLVSPAPDYWGYRGQNHYSIAPKEQLRWWLERAGWRIIKEEVMNMNTGVFLVHWREELVKAGHLDPNKKETHFPAESKDVEYRFLCRHGEEVVR
jgi:SAM-dependent methyltransferase